MTLVHVKQGQSATGLTNLQLGGNVLPAGGDHVNAPWSWRVDLDTVELMQEVEVCDSWPAYMKTTSRAVGTRA